MKSERIAYALATRNIGARGGVEVLLHRRATGLSLMPDMLELPPLREAPSTQPMLRLRHAIVGTNYYAEVFGIRTRQQVHRAAQAGHQTAWFDTQLLNRLPLTGLARKVLQRTGLMAPAANLSALPISPASIDAVSPRSHAQPQKRAAADNGSAPLFTEEQSDARGEEYGH